MTAWGSIDSTGTKNRHDVFLVRKTRSGGYMLSIGVVAKGCFTQDDRVKECIVLNIFFDKYFEQTDEEFQIKNIVLESECEYEYYRKDIQSHCYDKNIHKVFVRNIINMARKISTTSLRNTDKDFVSAMMILFCDTVEKEYTISCKDYGKSSSPKNSIYLENLLRCIRGRKNTSQRIGKQKKKNKIKYQNKKRLLKKGKPRSKKWGFLTIHKKNTL